MNHVTREVFWQTTRTIERWHKPGVRFSQYEVLEQGDGYQIQAKTWRCSGSGEILAQYKSRVENAAHVSSEYLLRDCAHDH